MKCGYCGKNIRDDAAFCTYCGHNLSELPSEESSTPPAKTSTLGACLTLLAILILLGVGSACLLHGPDKTPKYDTVSPTNLSTVSLIDDDTSLDEALIGKWTCTDPAAADYEQSDYGINVKIILTMAENGKFKLNYKMTDTGAPALKLTLNGDYRSKDGVISFKPDLSKLDGETGSDFFRRHGKTPTFTYTVTDRVLILHYENDIDVTFKRVSES